MSFTIAMVQQKGGTGKTTIADQLAFTLQEMGYVVEVADLDDQQGILFHKVHEKPETDPDFLIVDTGGSFNTKFNDVSIDDIIANADLVIIPVLLEPDSLKPTTLTARRCESNNKDYRILFNQVQPNQVLHQILIEQFKNAFPGKVFDTTISKRAAISQARMISQSVTSISKRSRVTGEFIALVDEIKKEVV